MIFPFIQHIFRTVICNRRISKMTYQPKRVGKIADFETLTLCIYLSKFKSNVYLFLQGLSYKVLSEPGKKFDSQSSSVFILTLLLTPCCYGVESREIRL